MASTGGLHFRDRGMGTSRARRTACPSAKRSSACCGSALGEYTSTFVDELSGTYATRTYCVQYRETSFDFVSRLMEQEGIYYFFRHENGKHSLVLADSAAAHDPFEDYAALPYRPRAHQGDQTAETITDWSVEKEIQPGLLVLGDSERSGLLHLQHPARAVVAHAGHDDAHGVLAGVAGSGAKEHIDRRAMSADQRAVLDRHAVLADSLAQQQVEGAGGHQGAARAQRVAIAGFGASAGSTIKVSMTPTSPAKSLTISQRRSLRSKPKPRTAHRR